MQVKRSEEPPAALNVASVPPESPCAKELPPIIRFGGCSGSVATGPGAVGPVPHVRRAPCWRRGCTGARGSSVHF